MDVGEFLQALYIARNTSSARCPDGSGAGDGVAVYLDVEGYGELLRAEVDIIRIHPCTGNIYVQATGKKREEV